MTRLPALSARQVLAALKRAGFVIDRQTGSHVVLRHYDKNLMTVVPIHSEDLPRWVLKQIIKQAGLSEAEFRKLL